MEEQCCECENTSRASDSLINHEYEEHDSSSEVTVDNVDVDLDKTDLLSINSAGPRSEKEVLLENGIKSYEDDKEGRPGSSPSSAQVEEDPVPNGGWGWIVVIGASFTLMSVDTIGQCFGIIFSTYLLEEGASSTTIGWMINIFFFFFCLTGLPLSPILQEFGWRKVAFIASISLSVGTIASAFTTSVWALYLSYSFLAGVSCGALLNISYTIVPHYFSSRRGLACGIIMALDSGGQIVAPPLVKMLQEEYTYRGATLILGGIVLNCCAAAAVFHPVEWHSKSISPKSTSKKISQCSNDDPKSEPLHITRIFSSMVTNLKILQSARAIIIAFGATMFLCGYQNFMAFMPFVVQDAGYSLGDAAICVSISAVCNMVTRFLVALASDYTWFNYRLSMLLSSALLTTTLLVFSFIRDLRWMMVLMGIWGIGVGSYMCLFSLVMIHYMGLNKLISMMGATMMVIAISNVTVGPLAGLVRDLTGTYSSCIWVLTGLSSVSFLLWLCMPLAIKFDLHRRANEKRDL